MAKKSFYPWPARDYFLLHPARGYETSNFFKVGLIWADDKTLHDDSNIESLTTVNGFQ